MPFEILRLSNFDFINQSARSEVQDSAASGQKVLTVQSPAGFVDERFIVLAPNTERAEICQIDALSGSELTLKANLTHTHQPGDTVVQLLGDQLKVYRAANSTGQVPSDDDFTHCTTTPANPIAIQPDQTFTAVTDADGGSDYWYKVVYLNSVTLTETDKSLSLAVRGGDYGHYASLSDIREQAGFSFLDYVTDTQVSFARDQAESEIDARLGSCGYTLPISVDVPLLTSITQILGAGHLLRRSYGVGNEGSTKDGAALLKDGRAFLDQISAGTLQLVDIDGNILANTANSSGQSGSVEGSCRPPIFCMDQEF